MDELAWQQRPESDRDLPSNGTGGPSSMASPPNGSPSHVVTANTAAPNASPPIRQRIRGLEAANVRLKAERDYLQCQLDHLRRRVLLLDQGEGRAESTRCHAPLSDPEEDETEETIDAEDERDSSLSDSLDGCVIGGSRRRLKSDPIPSASGTDDRTPRPGTHSSHSSLDFDRSDEAAALFLSGVDTAYLEVEDNHETKYAPIGATRGSAGPSTRSPEDLSAALATSDMVLPPCAIPPKVTIHRKLLRRPAALSRLSYPTSSTSNSSDPTPCATGHLRHPWHRLPGQQLPPSPPQEVLSSPTKQNSFHASRGTQTPPPPATTDLLNHVEETLLTNESRVTRKKRTRHAEAVLGQRMRTIPANQALREMTASRNAGGAPYTAPNTPEMVARRGGFLERHSSSEQRGLQILAAYRTGRKIEANTESCDFLAPLNNVQEVYAFVKGRVHLVQSSQPLERHHDVWDSDTNNATTPTSAAVNGAIAAAAASDAAVALTESPDSCDECCSCLAAKNRLLHNGADETENVRDSSMTNTAAAPMSESVTSMGYYSPPDDVSLCSGMSRSVEGGLSVNSPTSAGPSATCVASLVAPERRVLRNGPLSKLSAKFKMWHKHWCILTNKGLFFYTVRPKQNERPSQCISLSEIIRIGRAVSSSGTSASASAAVSVPSSGCHGDSSFEVRTRQRSFVLSAESIGDAELWLRKFRQALRRHRAQEVMRRNASKLLHRGWLKRVKCATARRLWCVLAGNYLLYFRGQHDLCPTGYRDLSCSLVQPVSLAGLSQADNSDSSDTNEPRAQQHRRTISLWHRQPCGPRQASAVRRQKDPVYLMAPSDHDCDRWLHYLSVVCRRSDVGVASTRLVAPEEVLSPWAVGRFHFSPAALAGSSNDQPLSLSTAQEHRELAAGLAAGLDQLAGGLSSGEERARLMKRLALTAFEHPGLKDELFLLLLKQTQEAPVPAKNAKRSRRHWIGRQHLRHGTDATKRSPSRSSSSSGGGSGASGSHSGTSAVHSKASAPEESLAVMWRCLALFIPLFLPSPVVLAFLKQHLSGLKQRRLSLPAAVAASPLQPSAAAAAAAAPHSPPLPGPVRTEVQKYAAFCLDSICRVEQNGGRARPPSSLEILSVHMHPPYSHSKPFSLPIHLPFGSYRVVGFDGSSTIEEVLEYMAQLLAKRSVTELSPFVNVGLFCRTPEAEMVYLDERWKLGDVISRCEEQMWSRPGSSSSPSTPVKQPDAFSAQIFFLVRSNASALLRPPPVTNLPEDSLLPLLKASMWQIHADIKAGWYCISGRDLLRLNAHLCQCEYGNYRDLKNKDATLTKIVLRHFPSPLIDEEERVMHLKLLLLEEWSILSKRAAADACRAFLTQVEVLCSKAVSPRIAACRCQDTGQSVYLLVTATQFVVVSAENHTVLQSTSLKDFVSFGGHGAHTLFVVHVEEQGLAKRYFRFAGTAAVLEMVKTLRDVLSRPEPGTRSLS